MTPAARVQAAIEVLDAVIAAVQAQGAPADRVLSDWFRPRRFAGSGDRRAVRDLVYAAIRLCGEVPVSGRAAMALLAKDDPALAALFDGSRHAPAPITAGEPIASAGVAPGWLIELLAQCAIDGAAAKALLGRAPLDLRVNTLRASRETLALPEPAEPTLAPDGLRLGGQSNVENWDAFRAGQVEVQDSGSQIACLAVGAQPGETVIDLCAGAGGKTLALAAAMDNRGVLLACDTVRARLDKLPPRAERAGAHMIDTALLNPNRELEALAAWHGRADAVLVDAPCSGTGIWRRNPEARWRLRPADIARYAEVQGRLLDLATCLVRPKGRLIFVTCSLLDAEGADGGDAFLARHPGWRADVLDLPAGEPRGDGIRLTPYRDGTDGFFIARFVSP